VGTSLSVSNSTKPQFRVLIVDDEPINLQALANNLSVANYSVTQATNGIEALDLLKSEQAFDLVILDVMMPRLSGYEVCRRLRKDYPRHQLPVIMLTAKNQVTDLVTGFEFGASDYITKPFSKDELLIRIKTHLQLAKTNIAYGRFVPHEFLQLLEKESIVDVQVGDHVQRSMSVLFSDIRDFATLSESMTSQDNFKFINAYLSRMEPIIAEHHGFIDKYIGDAIMALFSGTADDALKAGIAMLKRLADYNQARQKMGRQPIQIGIGINTGSLMLGTVGGYNRMDGSVISDTVNLASRVESLTKNYEVPFLITNHTFLQLRDPDDYAIRLIDRVKVKGKSEIVSVFEVFDADPPELFEGKSVTRTTFEQALSLYNSGSFNEAVKLFQDVLSINPRDKVVGIYLKRCQTLKRD